MTPNSRVDDEITRPISFFRTTVFATGRLIWIRFHEHEDRCLICYRCDPMTFTFADNSVIVAFEYAWFLSLDVKRKGTI